MGNNMEVPKKFLIFWMFVMVVIYTCSGLIYNEQTMADDIVDGIKKQEGDKGTIYINQSDVDKAIQENEDWWTQLASFFGNAVNMVLFLLNVAFFNFPHIPVEVQIGMNIVMFTMNTAFFIGIYPYLKDLAHTIIQILDLIIPDWL